MESYVFISVISLICYAFLFLIFASAKKNKVINSFLLILAASIAWTGGSLCMRAMLWPSYEIWYHVSLCGILFMAYAYPRFICALSGEKHILMNRILLFATIACCIINMPSGILLAAPQPVQAESGVRFVYHMTWTAGIVFTVAGVSVIVMLIILTRNCIKDKRFARRVHPIIIGIIVMFIGNIAISLPFLKGFPIDILSSLINALLVFYALIRCRLFKMKLLASEGICYGASLVLMVLIFYFLTPQINHFLEIAFPTLSNYYNMMYAVLFFLLIICVTFLIKYVMNSVFVKEETIQNEYLKKFSTNVSKSLNLKAIYSEIVKVIKSATDIQNVYIAIASNKEDTYKIVYSDNPLDDISILLRKDHPIIRWLLNNDDCLHIKEFRHTVEYHSMWEEEKHQLRKLNIQCCIGLRDKNHLIGVIMLSNNPKKKEIGYTEMSFLSSISSVASIAVINSKLYETAVHEARTDDLTGLLNRKSFYEVIQKAYKKCKDSSLALVLLNFDDFKLYNQLYGTKEGDIALQKAASIIRASIGTQGYAARYSGKEFAIVLPHFDVLSAKRLTENICEQIRQMNKTSSDDYTLKAITVSAGISAYPFGCSDVKELMENADMSVYFIKHNGKNGIKVFDVAEHGMKDDCIQDCKDTYSNYESTIYALTAAIDTKDHYTFRHSNNVAYYAAALSRAIGMNEEFTEIVRQSGLLHDIGKIGIPETILNKPGKLTNEEYDVIKQHPESAVAIIRHLPSLDYVVPAVLGHHERFDGRGYPRRISGHDIPLAARILCIADSFDAMISKRSYKDSMALEKVLHILEEEAGGQFDPELVPVFIKEIRSGSINVIHNDIN